MKPTSERCKQCVSRVCTRSMNWDEDEEDEFNRDCCRVLVLGIASGSGIYRGFGHWDCGFRFAGTVRPPYEEPPCFILGPGYAS